MIIIETRIETTKILRNYSLFQHKEEMPFLANDDVATCGARCGRPGGSPFSSRPSFL